MSLFQVRTLPSQKKKKSHQRLVCELPSLTCWHESITFCISDIDEFIPFGFGLKKCIDVSKCHGVCFNILYYIYIQLQILTLFIDEDSMSYKIIYY